MPGKCRACGTQLQCTFVDLGLSPLANGYVKPEDVQKGETFFPLHVYVCSQCFLVQIEEFQPPEEIFRDYRYFSSFSDTWLKHAEAYTESMVKRFGLNTSSQVVEVASNDGYLLQFFHNRSIPVLGVEPASTVAQAALDKGISTIVDFFGTVTARRLAAEGKSADLLIGNNVLAHVPDLNDFVAGLAILLKPNGVITLEFPHLVNLIRGRQFDTIYHEHFSYLSLLALRGVLARAGLRLFDVEELATHGGSLRVFLCHSNAEFDESPAVAQVREKECVMGLHRLETYAAFQRSVLDIKAGLLEFLIETHRSGKTVVGYGAPAKGNTLLVYAGVRSDLIPFTVDKNPHKQGMLLPGTLIPIKSPEVIHAARPDYLLVLPWNLKEEIMEQMSYVREWGGRFVVAIPEVKVFA